MLFLPHFGFVVFLTIMYRRCYIITTCPLCEQILSYTTINFQQEEENLK